jgi:hypothetical protein
VFLLSPANLNGQRGRSVLNPGAQFPLARELRSMEGAQLGELFSFVSGLYFRGKMTYAGVFGSPGGSGDATAFVISQGEGLRSLSERVTAERLRRWGDVPIDADNPRFTEPLIEDAQTLELVHDRATRFVLLGSIATDKYVRPLTEIFGTRLLFPSDFIGRGDMSRGALLLRAASERRELRYERVLGARRHGPRAPSIAKRSRA